MTGRPDAATQKERAIWWDEAASIWASLGLADNESVRGAIAKLACSPGDLLLDAGCGAGRWALPLASLGHHVHGIDLSPEMIAEARALQRRHGLDADDVQFEAGDLAALPFADETFDGIICRLVLDWLPSPGAALTELRRVLEPGCRLVVSTLGAHSPVRQRAWRRFLPRTREPWLGNHILPWEMEALLAELGWEILTQEPGFEPAVSGAKNEHTPESCAHIRDRVILQAVATTWEIVARKPAGDRRAEEQGGAPQ